jgi:hypothetical protein
MHVICFWISRVFKTLTYIGIGFQVKKKTQLSRVDQASSLSEGLTFSEVT